MRRWSADMRNLTWRAWKIEAETARTWNESIDLMRIGRTEIEANPDGIGLSGALIEALALAGQISRTALADPKSSAFKAGIDRYRPMLDATPAYLWVTTPSNSRTDQIAAGRAYVRANLVAGQAGLSMHPVSQGAAGISGDGNRVYQPAPPSECCRAQPHSDARASRLRRNRRCNRALAA